MSESESEWEFVWRMEAARVEAKRDGLANYVEAKTQGEVSIPGRAEAAGLCRLRGLPVLTSEPESSSSSLLSICATPSEEWYKGCRVAMVGYEIRTMRRVGRARPCDEESAGDPVALGKVCVRYDEARTARDSPA